jgi:two-component system OmpR family response regulator
MAKLLLIDDDETTEMLVREVFERDYDVLVARSAHEAMHWVSAASPDLVLLDIGLPDSDGFQLFPKLRAHEKMGRAPIFFLTGRSAVNDRVAAFAAGADDYLVKPFFPLELRARVEARLSRGRREVEAVLSRGGLVVDQSRMRVVAHPQQGQPTELDLTACEFRILVHLLRHEGHVISRDQLLDSAWPDGVHVLDRTVDRHISHLKKKIEMSDVRIETVRGFGYRLLSGPP